MTTANSLTLGRFLCATIVFAEGWHKMWAACLAAYAIGLVTDAVDGRLARATSTTTPFGRAMDSAADKTLAAAAMLALASAARLPAWLVFSFIAREFAVFGLRAIRLPGGGGVAEIADAIGRARFFFLHAGIATLLLPESPHLLHFGGICVVAFATCLAYASLIFYIARDRAILRAAMRKSAD
jgi:phosphatidylglycerophosphate synthase